MLLPLLLDAFKQRKCLNAGLADSLYFFVVTKVVWQHMCAACCRCTGK